jgi:outer membrane protein assembly factor BamB
MTPPTQVLQIVQRQQLRLERFGVLGPYLTSPAIVDGIVYITGYSLFAFNASTGKTIWEQMDSGYSSPVVENGIVYSYGSAFNASTGFKIWSTPISSAPGGSIPIAVADGYFYTLGKQGVICLDASTGALVWSSDYKCISPSPSVSNGYNYFGTGHSIVALNAGTGIKLWEHQTADEAVSSPAVDADHVYVNTQDGVLLCLDTASGTKIWNYTMVWTDSFYSSPTAAYGYVYVGSGDGNVYAFDASTGAKIWNYTTLNRDQGYGIQSSPAIANGAVYVGADDGYLYAFNASTGNKLWSYKIGEPQHMRCSPAIANGYIYMGSQDNFMMALETSTPPTAQGFSTQTILIVSAVAALFCNSCHYSLCNASEKRVKTQNLGRSKTVERC